MHMFLSDALGLTILDNTKNKLQKLKTEWSILNTILVFDIVKAEAGPESDAAVQDTR